jgi:hypothetical protein
VLRHRDLRRKSVKDAWWTPPPSRRSSRDGPLGRPSRIQTSRPRARGTVRGDSTSVERPADVPERSHVHARSQRGAHEPRCPATHDVPTAAADPRERSRAGMAAAEHAACVPSGARCRCRWRWRRLDVDGGSSTQPSVGRSSRFEPARNVLRAGRAGVGPHGFVAPATEREARGRTLSGSVTHRSVEPHGAGRREVGGTRCRRWLHRGFGPRRGTASLLAGRRERVRSRDLRGRKSRQGSELRLRCRRLISVRRIAR